MNNPWNLKVISINVNGIKTDMWTKLRSLHKQRFDIVLLQETKLHHDDLNDDLIYRWKQVTDGEAYTAPAASSQAGGVAILLSAHCCAMLTDREVIPNPSEQHRCLLLRASLMGQTAYIYSIYAPVHRSERPAFFNNLQVPTTPGNHIIGGDFNCVVDTQLDTTGDCNIASSGTAELLTWIATLGAIDAWRIQHDDRKEFTSPGGLSRIDMIFVSGCFSNHYSSHHAPRTIGSDHLCPTISIHSNVITPKGGHWQLPAWVAPHAAGKIKPTLEKLTQKTNQPNYIDLFTKTMKIVTSQCQATHTQLLRWRKNKTDRARLRWIRAHMRAIQSPTEELINDAERARESWLKEIEENGRKKRRWAFEKHFAEAERCSRWFFSRKKPGRATIIPGVKMPDDSVKRDSNSIQQQHSAYWSTLYSATSNGTEPSITQYNIDTLTNTNLPTLSPEATKSLEADITEEEIRVQIDKLPTRKAAGSDGLKAELFKQSPKTWAKILQPVFHRAIHHEQSLPESFRETIIILLYKKGCNLRPENYRPIALINVVAKILSGIHCSRLRRILHTVIPNEQTGFVPNRSITENIIMLQDAIHFSKRHHPSSIIVALDFAKAYDRVQWQVMIAILKRMGFGPKWLRTISTMYKERSARLSINDELTPHFPIQRGVLQGDPLSPALFILQCSPLYTKLNAARQSHGIPLPDGQTAPVATFYADDTNLIAKNPSSAVRLYNIAEWFCRHAGAKLHPGKCVAIPTGPAPLTLTNGITIIGPAEHTTILGVPMGLELSRQQQVGKVIASMMKKCNGWAHVGRTIEGRVTVVRSIILSTIWYIMAALPIVPSEAKNIQTIVNNFINRKEHAEWGDETIKGNMSNEWYYRPIKLGGWGLSPVMRTIRSRKLSLFKSYMIDKEKRITKPWHTFMPYMLMEHMSTWCDKWEDMYYWEGSHKHGEFALGRWEAIAPWWRDAWQEWLRLGLQPPRNSLRRSQLLQWPIWNNRILAQGHGLNGTLHRSFTNSTTKSHMAIIRRIGFTTFGSFMNQNGALMTAEKLYSAVTVSSSVHDVDHIVPQSACMALIRRITALWANVIRKWHLQSAHTPQQVTTVWCPTTQNATPFTKMRNNAITKLIQQSEPSRPHPKLITVRNDHVFVNWQRERATLKPLAPSRRDLGLRITRNALPVGTKRVHWGTNTQTQCLLCNDNVVESARHLFWDCSFARDVWRDLSTPWRTHRLTAITWDEVVRGHEVRLGGIQNTQIDQMWAITRICTMRVIWFERNRRYFYPNSPNRTAAFRHNQALDDITIHVECWARRSTDKVLDNVRNLVSMLKHRSNRYENINLTPQNGNFDQFYAQVTT